MNATDSTTATMLPAVAGQLETPVRRQLVAGGVVEVRGYQSANGGLYHDSGQALRRHFAESEIHPLVRAHDAHMAALDCRTCRHYTEKTGGCMSVVRCVQGCAYQRLGVRAYWSDK